MLCHQILRMILSRTVFSALLFLGLYYRCSAANPDFAQINTTGYGYIATGINLTGRSSFIFQVQTNSEVLVALISSPNVYTQSMFEVVFGANGGKDFYVRTATLGVEVAKTTGSPYSFLDPQGFVWFWISWSGGQLTLGEGGVPGNETLLMYPDTSPIANLTTVSVSSNVSGYATWIIPYDQNAVLAGLQQTKENRSDEMLDYDRNICKDLPFAQPSVNTYQGLRVVFVEGRSSIRFKLNTFTSLIKMSFFTSNTTYSFIGYQTGTTLTLTKNGVTMSTVNFASFFSQSAASGLHWFSWKNGVLAGGWGDVVGETTLITYYEEAPISPMYLRLMYNGPVYVRHGYFVGLTAMKHVSTPYNRTLNVRKVFTDGCNKGCLVDIVDNPSCSPMFCTTACSANPRCTAFCLRPPKAPSQSCSCYLHAQPGVPASIELYYSLVGAQYYELIA